MSGNIYHEKIMNIYEERRLANHHAENERKNEVYNAIPEYRELDTSASEIGSIDIRSVIIGGRDALDKTKNMINDVDVRKKNLLTSHGYPADYLDHIYTCPDCHDTGFIGSEKCHCYKDEFVKLIEESSNLLSYIDDENFDNFRIDYYSDDYVMKNSDMTPRDNIKRILEASRQFIDNFETEHDNILIYGNTGVGKTFLSHCIAAEILKKGIPVVYLTSYKLFEIIETGIFRREELDEFSSGVLSVLNTCDLLIIDDLGTEMINRFTETHLFSCIQERLANKVSTIISTNLSFDEINAAYSERIFSRLTGNYKLFKLAGSDIRIRKALSE